MRSRDSNIRGYNRAMIRRTVLLSAAGLFFAALAAFGQPAQEIRPYDTLWTSLQQAYEAGDMINYGQAFTSALRETAIQAASQFRDQWKMDRVLFRLSGRLKDKAGAEHVYLQVFYQNDISAMRESWDVIPVEDEGRWRIGGKEVTGFPTALYKLRMPTPKVDRAARVEVRHHDIVLTFDNASVFYDNIPREETALIVIGAGRFRFEPSDATEKHQLELRYGTPFLEDRLESAYLRFSDSFFRENIRISGGGKPAPAAGTERVESNEAYALFSKHYPASFTVENSLTDELLSFLPQGEQAVFDLKTKTRGNLTYIYSPFSEDEVHLIRRDPDRIICLYSPGQDVPAPGRRMLLSIGQRADVLAYRIDIDFQPEKYYLSAQARIDVSPQIEAADNLQFDFSPSLDILRIEDGEGRQLFYTQDRSRGLLYVYFMRPVEKGTTASIEVFYRGVLEPPILTADVLPGGQLNYHILLSDPRYETYLYSQSAFWYPAAPKDDYFQAALRIVVPPGYSCVASGVPTGGGQVSSLSRVTALDKVGHPYYTFETRSPVKYLAFIVGKFTALQNGSGASSRIPINAFASNDLRGQRKNILEETKAVFAAFEEWFGPYPFEKLSIVQRTWPQLGGHSPASFIILNELPRVETALAANPQSPVDLSRWREGTLAHEIAHQWWGQGTTWATYRDQWLSEGLAQFSAVLYLEHKLGPEVARGILSRFARWTSKKSKFGPITLGTRLWDLEPYAYQAVIYDKSALVLAMLRDLIGEDAFFRGLRAFFIEFRFRGARTSHFFRAMEAASGRDLAAFYEPWFRSHLLPRAAVSYADRKEGEDVILRFRVAQNGPAFVFPLWVSWRENGKVVRRMLDVDAPAKEFEFRCSSRPTRIKIDPDGLFPGALD